MTLSCISSDFEKPMVLRTRRLMRDLSVRLVLSILCVYRLPIMCFSAGRLAEYTL